MAAIDLALNEPTGEAACRCCGVFKPLDTFYVRKDTGRRRTDCKPCFNARVAERARENPERRRATQQAYVDRNRDRVRARNSEHKKANRARVNAEQAARRARQPDKEREYAKRRYERNSEKIKAARREWAAANRDRVLIYAKSYASRPEVRERIRQRAAERLRTDPVFAINHRMRTRLREALIVAGGKRGRSWEALVGYTSADLLAHLELQFVPGMSWSNMADWEIDHVVALSSFDIREAGDAEFRAAWALGNLRPLWRSANRSKSDRREFLL